MQLSIVVSTQATGFSALAYQGSLQPNLRKLKSFGYTGVELAVRDPALLDLPSLEDWLSDSGLSVTAIGTGQAFGEDGLSFTNKDPSIREKAINRIKSQIHLAKQFGAIVIIGLIRGNPDQDVAGEIADRWFLEAMQECADVDKNVKLAIEPCNRYEAQMINTAQEGLDFIRTLDRDNVGLLLDTFHMNIEEVSIYNSIKAAGRKLFYVHIADSNRQFPGAGHLDFEKIFDSLKGIGYQGTVSAEILPYPDPDTAAKRVIDNIQPLM